MAEAAFLVGSLTRAPERGEILPGLESLGALEWRADLLGEGGAGAAESGEAQVLFTLRSVAEGGRGSSSPGERASALGSAGDRFDLVDLEAERDLTPEVLAAVPPEKRIISWHGGAATLSELRERFATMAATPARWYKLVAEAAQPSDAIAPLALLHDLQRDDVIAFSSGEAGAWSRLLAPRLGAPVVYARAQREAAAPGQFSVEELCRDYGLPDLPRVSELAGIVGRPVLHSLSPRLHNVMFRRLGLGRLFLPFHVPVFGDFWLDVIERGSLAILGFDLRALAVTAPFKEIALAVSGAASPLAERVSAANTLVRRGQVWEAECTDTEGVTAPLAARGLQLEGLRAAVVGAGGAGRAALYALDSAGCLVTLVNRSVHRGRRVARELGVEFTRFADFDPGDLDVVVNATPLGSGAEMPFEIERLSESAVVVDLAYRRDGATGLVEAARAAGHDAVDGREVLLHQAVPQFRWMNGEDLDLDAGREALGLSRS